MVLKAHLSGVAWPDRRLDVIEALRRLAPISKKDAGEFPTLTNAIHWLIDDTFWDQHSPSEEIGLILRNEPEVNAVNAVLQPLLEIFDDLGPLAPDGQYYDHARWPEMKVAAASAASELTRANATHTPASREPDES